MTAPREGMSGERAPAGEYWWWMTLRSFADVAHEWAVPDEEIKVQHRTAGPSPTGPGREVDRVPALLLKAHDALRGATHLIAPLGASESAGRSTTYAQSLSAFLKEVEDATSTALGGTLDEADRRSVLMALYVRGDAGRIAVLIEQVGDLAARRGAQGFAGPALRPVLELGESCVNLVAQAHDVLRLPGPLTVLDQGLADVTASQRRLSGLLLTSDLHCSAREAADAAVLGRCYEECAWRAVALAGVGLQARDSATSGR
ncbi:hypothetical protein [Streptomyces sp. NPDC048568]|uniref:hypothetical protein n=1 Tax=Streptomyces sp. NPDC048568 TaxID=3365571 RepID=UPI00371C2C90